MWRTLFPQLTKWTISATFLIIGIACLAMVQEGHKGALILAVFSLGIVYWQYKSRSEIPWQVAAISLALLAIGAAAAIYLSVAHFPFNMGFYPAWIGWTLSLGIPVIALSYRKYG